MTDVSDDQSAHPRTLQIPGPEADATRVELQFPQLFLEASFHSLLTHSFSSDRASTVITMPQPGESLSESWTALSDADLSHDEDLRSETTDAGSLIDIHNADDICSVQEDGQISDIDTEDEDNNDTKMPHYRFRVSDEVEANTQKYQSDSHYFRPTMAMASSIDTIILDEPQMMSRSIRGITGYHATKPLPTEEFWQRNDLSEPTTQHGDECAPDLISMAMSKAKLDLGQRPFRVLYIVSPAVTAQIKDEVLRKVGSVLVTEGMNSRLDVPCYHVIPSEFGPGAKPDTSELIPVGTQMIVHEHTMQATMQSVKNVLIGTSASDNATTFRITDSGTAEILGVDGSWHQPDLLLALVSDRDEAMVRQHFMRLLSSVRHQLPTIVVKQEPGRRTSPPYLRMDTDSLHQMSQMQVEDAYPVRVPVDVNVLVALDSEQLNRHVQFLIEASSHTARRKSRTTVKIHREPVFKWSKKILPSLLSYFGQANDMDSDSYMLKTDVADCSTTSRQFKPCGHKEQRIFVNFSRPIVYAIVVMIISSILVAVCPAPFALLRRQDQAQSPSILQTPTEASSSIQIPTATCTSSRTNSVTSGVHEHNTDLRNVYNLDQLMQMLTPTRRTPDLSHLPKKDKSQSSEMSEHGRLATENEIANCQHKEVVRRAGWGNYLTLPDGFFDTGCAMPAFEVLVTRNQTAVPHRIEVQATNACVIRVKRLDLHGVLNVILETKSRDETMCAQVDLRDSLLEVLMLRMNESIRKMKDYGIPMQSDSPGQEYVALLEVRPFTAGKQKSLGQLTSRIMQSVQATSEKIEKSVVRQGRACHQYNEDCIIRQSLTYRDRVVASSRLATKRAKLFTDNILNQSSKACSEIRHSIPFVGSGSLDNIFPYSEISWTVAKAQKRAKQLVNRASSVQSSLDEGNSYKHRECDFS